jgi:hypothetical protein
VHHSHPRPLPTCDTGASPLTPRSAAMLTATVDSARLEDHHYYCVRPRCRQLEQQWTIFLPQRSTVEFDDGSMSSSESQSWTARTTDGNNDNVHDGHICYSINPTSIHIADRLRQCGPDCFGSATARSLHGALSSLTFTSDFQTNGQ